MVVKHILTIGIALLMGILIPMNGYGDALRVVTEEWPPFNYLEDGKITGFATDIVKACLVEAGFTFEIEVLPWARAYAIATNTPNIIIYTIGREPPREHLFHWIGPITPRLKEICYKLKKRKDIQITSIDDLQGYSIGVVRQELGHQLLVAQGFKEGKNLEPVPLQGNNIKKLFYGRIDIFIGLNLMVPAEVRRLGYRMEELETAYVLSEGDGYMALNVSSDKETVRRIRSGFETIKTKGLIEQIIDRYVRP